MSDSARATPVPERDQQLLSVGKQCSHVSCNLVDFLPFKCQHCQQSFCQEHFKVDDHKCPSYDASKHDRIAPSCPLCNTPVAIPPGQDPNIRMERHFTQECSVMLGKEVKKSTPICARGKCGKVLYAPIRCDKCQKQFCPTHRFPSDHTCTPVSSTASSSRPGALTANSRLLKIQNEINQKAQKASAAGVAAADAIKKSMTTTAPVKASTSTSSGSSHKNPFSKTDSAVPLPTPLSSTMINGTNDDKLPPAFNPSPTATSSKSKPTPVIRSSYIPPPIFATARARAERDSRKKALRERAKKGLLSEQEKAQLAAAEAEDAAEEKDKKDCIIM
ncbi:hypothetical protein PM082_017393 [Marasmius tenuissimus]|nr:hypothetical protein PM082_017393 [Marasmius tenuissimus]